MGTLEELVDKYCEGWSADHPDVRERLIRETLTQDAIYSDPRADRLDLLALLKHIDSVHASRPGAKVCRTSKVDTHHGFARFHWCVVLPDGNRLPEGIDLIELSAGGSRIKRIVGFFGPLPSVNPGDAQVPQAQ